MPENLKLTAELEPHGPAGAFLLTDEQVAAIGGGKKAFPVQVTVNGHTLRQRLARMNGLNMIGFAKAARAEAGLEIGATYDVEIGVDEGERTVEMPTDLAAALENDPAALRAFTALSFTHRKEFVRWVSEAKRAATRSDRVAKTVEMVREGKTR